MGGTLVGNVRESESESVERLMVDKQGHSGIRC